MIKKLLGLIILIGFMLGLASMAEGAWYNSSWPYRVKVTILATKVDTDITDYPIYVNLSNLPAGFHTHVNQTDARDIRVTQSDGTTELPREVVSYDAATDSGELHVKYSGTLSGTTDTDIYIYYGNAAASDYAATDTYGRNNVWESSLKMVQHLKDLTTSSTDDSTSNNNDGTKIAANEPIEADGKIAKAQSFDGTNDYVDCGAGASLSITGAITIEAWVNAQTLNSDYYNAIMIKGTSNDVNYLFRTDARRLAFVFRTSAGLEHAWRTNSTISTGQWLHLVARYISGDANSAQIYVNGILYSGSWISGDGTANLDASSGVLKIGCGHWNDPTDFFDGLIDEVRIYNRALSAEEVSTKYNNTNSPSTFYSVGSEENLGDFFLLFE